MEKIIGWDIRHLREIIDKTYADGPIWPTNKELASLEKILTYLETKLKIANPKKKGE